jgi:hypothetical protein
LRGLSFLSEPLNTLIGVINLILLSANAAFVPLIGVLINRKAKWGRL